MRWAQRCRSSSRLARRYATSSCRTGESMSGAGTGGTSSEGTALIVTPCADGCVAGRKAPTRRSGGPWSPLARAIEEEAGDRGDRVLPSPAGGRPNHADDQTEQGLGQPGGREVGADEPFCAGALEQLAQRTGQDAV